VADALKFLFKEDPVPFHVNKLLFNLGPFLALLPASLTMAALPIGDHLDLFGRTIYLQITELDVGIVYILAIGSLGIYGILFGGWASNNKFSLMGALRSSSQIISYEVPLGLAAAAAVTVYGTFSLREMVLHQEGLFAGFLPNWGFFYQPLGFLVFFISAFAETNRLPFDLPETEGELVAGFHTEYGSMKFAVYFMAEYMNMALISGVVTTLYFGGWHVPWITDAALKDIFSQNIAALIGVAAFSAKLGFFMLIFVWILWTIPRFRFDQLLRVAWVNLIPLGLINIVITAVVLYLRDRL
jgi:NADH-quinone oxidoreductase subunit H